MICDDSVIQNPLWHAIAGAGQAKQKIQKASAGKKRSL
jgi:hypothetical protein